MIDLTRNRLDQETSPYLRQHQHNPVHWQGWHPEVLAAARAADKPILLSIGYAACHWCHVMAHESFDDPAIAALMNRHFVNIKIDREERPDLDALYQAALAQLGQPGGWPLTMFLTPDGGPFWGGTYFPPRPRYGRPGFDQVLEIVAETYHARPEAVAGNVAEITGALKRLHETGGPSAGLPDSAQLDTYAHTCLRFLDLERGGTRNAPKFPQPVLFASLWRAAQRSGDAALKGAVLLTLDHLCQGGIYDHLGGGFARYATDADWCVPHFEKMLYDNALLIPLLCRAWQDTANPLYATRVAETVQWMIDAMTLPEGGFAASLDADSEGDEGRYYVWTAAEIAAVLPDDQTALMSRYYGVTPGGNWEGRCVLTRVDSGLALADHATEDRLAAARAALLAVRARRVAPARDDKLLTDWNAMAIAALAEAGRVFDRPDWRLAARDAFSAVCRHLGSGDQLAHSYCRGRVGAAGLLEDYAQMILAALTLYETEADDTYLTRAIAWAAAAAERFRDPDDGAYTHSPADAADVLVAQKPYLDNATPSGNGSLAQGLARLHVLTADPAYRRQAEAIITAFTPRLSQYFPQMSALLDAADLLANAAGLVLAGTPASPAFTRLHDAVFRHNLPHRVLGFASDDRPVPAGHPAAGKTAPAGGAVLYLCQHNRCSAPLHDPDGVAALLLSAGGDGM